MNDKSVLLGEIAVAYWYNVTIMCSVCLSVTFVHCAQTAEDIDMIFLQSHVSPRSC